MLTELVLTGGPKWTGYSGTETLYRLVLVSERLIGLGTMGDTG